MIQTEIEALLDRARHARTYSYSPYSKFAVGAAVLCADGSIFEGVNIENASFGLTNCAERTAIFSALAAGQREFVAIAIVADTAGPCAPCGACRQVMQEFQVPLVLMGNIRGEYKSVTLEALLPYSFSAEQLEDE